MKPRLLLTLAAALLAAAPVRAQQSLHVDTSGNPTVPLNLSGPNVSGGGKIAALGSTTPVTSPSGYNYLLYGRGGHVFFSGTTPPVNALGVNIPATPVVAVPLLDGTSSLPAANLAGTVAAARVTADAGLSISGASQTHLTANGIARTSRKITFAAGSAPYLADLILDVPAASSGVAADSNGTWQDMRLEFPAGGSAGVRILAADGVTVLFSEVVTPSSSIPAYVIAAQFVCPATVWRLHDSFLTP